MKVKKTIIKKTIMVSLFLLCLLVLGAVSAADNDAIVGSDVTEGAACLNERNQV